MVLMVEKGEGGASSRGISFGLFKKRGQINCKIVLDIFNRHRGFTRQPVTHTCTIGNDASNTTQIPREDPRERERENECGREKKGNFGLSGGGGREEGTRKLVSRK